MSRPEPSVELKDGCPDVDGGSSPANSRSAMGRSVGVAQYQVVGLVKEDSSNEDIVVKVPWKDALSIVGVKIGVDIVESLTGAGGIAELVKCHRFDKEGEGHHSPPVRRSTYVLGRLAGLERLAIMMGAELCQSVGKIGK